MTCPVCIANPRPFLTQSTNPLISHEEVPLVYNNTFIGIQCVTCDKYILLQKLTFSFRFFVISTMESK